MKRKVLILFVLTGQSFSSVQGGPKNKPLSRTIIKSY